ncbi:MBOAT family O-acyltransferase [Psychroserpens sp.]|uniref:MBOAT family O-acyltransferase n=1 Tax=Psychroserpens sp. TaxID=2020870 RepID=UPI001B234C55|nr:MBOAT family O-acyltransferase [Psychroserpens sp.]MBO6606962.1 MBOAT family protein [Psychroserpens sp.]MBO6654108.1 MBOAT family protein [Psychroserpens sp.]MBO6682606.1 MBOAT family protein [Psychroserpens sp.]MBO6750734.1 MBOAT family protein [Psychroserpens sp.]MBO6915837.1 MBOAT family protein [Psychroserpens sp.]
MLFNSIDFVIFLPIVFACYWLLRRFHVNYQNSLVVISSYLFYAWWDYRFLSLIIFSTIVDYLVGNQLKIANTESKRKLLLGCSLIANLGLLGFFKYYNFFIESWIEAWSKIGVELEISTLKIILPVGISFYTFQTLSYTIDVYRNKIEPTHNIFQFAAFVSFFPQLVAGPIERAKNLLPQFGSKRDFDTDTAMSGIYLIIWGLFKKMVIADNCAFFVNQIFNNTGNFSSAELFVGAMLFGFQIYGDFSGYSDIAIGVARLFGIKLMTNFSFPYFSRNIAEFWRRWHISLSTWFRDYLYIPLGGSKGNTIRTIRNVFVVFIVSGFWHGANWTFIIWGLIHAILFLPLLISNRNRTYINTNRIHLVQLPQILITFLLVTIAWIFFRADSVTTANQYIYDIISFNGASLESYVNSSKRLLFSLFIVISIVILLIFEFIAVQKDQEEVKLSNAKAVFIMLIICFMGVFKNPSDFIYFQF